MGVKLGLMLVALLTTYFSFAKANFIIPNGYQGKYKVRSKPGEKHSYCRGGARTKKEPNIAFPSLLKPSARHWLFVFVIMTTLFLYSEALRSKQNKGSVSSQVDVIVANSKGHRFKGSLNRGSKAGASFRPQLSPSKKDPPILSPYGSTSTQNTKNKNLAVDFESLLHSNEHDHSSVQPPRQLQTSAVRSARISDRTQNSNLYYPDWDAKVCKTDGGHPPYMNNAPEVWMHETLEACCSINYG